MFAVISIILVVLAVISAIAALACYIDTKGVWRTIGLVALTCLLVILVVPSISRSGRDEQRRKDRQAERCEALGGRAVYSPYSLKYIECKELPS